MTSNLTVSQKIKKLSHNTLTVVTIVNWERSVFGSTLVSQVNSAYTGAYNTPSQLDTLPFAVANVLFGKVERRTRHQIPRLLLVLLAVLSRLDTELEIFVKHELVEHRDDLRQGAHGWAAGWADGAGPRCRGGGFAL